MQRCPACGSEIQGAKKFCARCGQALTADAARGRSAQSQMFASQQPAQQPVQQPMQQPAPQQTGAPENQLAQQMGPKMTYNIIWIAMLSACVIYLVIGAVFLNFPPRDYSNQMIMLIILTVMGLGSLTGGILYFKLTVTPAKLAELEHAESVAGTIQTGSIISMALIEAVAIYGLALYMIAFPLLVLVPFVAAAIIGMIVHRITVEPAWKYYDELKQKTGQ